MSWIDEIASGSVLQEATPGCRPADCGDELQAHPEGFRGAEQSFQRRFGSQPFSSRLITARVSAVRSDRSVRLNPNWFAHHAVFDHHGAETLGRRGRAGRETAPEPAPDPKGGR